METHNNQFNNNVNLSKDNNSNEQSYGEYAQNYNNQQYIPYNNYIETPEEKKKADSFCWLSLGLVVVPPILTAIIAALMYGIATLLGLNLNEIQYELLQSDNILVAIFGIAYYALYGLTAIARVAAFVVMIYVRVKFPKNTFGKVLMWLYISVIAICLIALFVMLASCLVVAKNCPG